MKWSWLGSRFVGGLWSSLGWIPEPGLWALLGISLVLWTLAYQQPYSHHLAIGGDRATQRRNDDSPYLQNVNDSEPEPGPGDPRSWWQLPQEPYRWTQADSAIVLPGMGGGAWIARVRATGQPGRTLTTSRWSDAASPTVVNLPGAPRVYRLLVRPDTAGDLALRFETPPLNAPGDPRSLGIVLYRVSLATSAGPRLPALAQLGVLAGTLALAYGLMRNAGLPRAGALAGGVALAALAAWLIVSYRAGLAVFTPVLLPLAAGSYLGCWMLDVGSFDFAQDRFWILEHDRARSQEPGARSQEQGRPPRTISPPRSGQRGSFLLPPSSFILPVVVLAFALRLGGMLHPHTIFSDIGLNTNNLAGVTRGELFFTEGLPARAGGGQAPYPPGGYILLAPLQLVLPVNDEGRRLLFKVGAALLDSLSAGGLWYVLRRAGLGERAAILGAALYLLPKPILVSFSVGEFANLLGQSLAIPLLALLGLGLLRLHDKRLWASALALLGLSLLGHTGVAISVALLMLALAALVVVRLPGRLVAAFIALGVAGSALAGLFYYSAFVHLAAGPTPVGPAQVADPLARLAGVLRTIDSGRTLLSPLLLCLGLAGMVLLLSPITHHPPSHVRSLSLLLLAWWLGALVSLTPLLFTNQTVRWSAFLYPALCLGAGPALDACWRRGAAGRAVVPTTLTFLLWNGGAFWVRQLADYLH